MGTITGLKNISQSLMAVRYDLLANEVLTIVLESERNAKVNWDDGGVSWTIQSRNAYKTKVEHSLANEGDDAELWTEDDNSPFSNSKGSEGNEGNRIERIRFTAETNGCTVVVASGSKFKGIIT